MDLKAKTEVRFKILLARQVEEEEFVISMKLFLATPAKYLIFFKLAIKDQKVKLAKAMGYYLTFEHSKGRSS